MSPNVSGGRPRIRSRRIRAKDALDLLTADTKPDEILAHYHWLEPGDIAAVLEFAGKRSDHAVLRNP